MEGKKISFGFIKTKKVDKPVIEYDEKKEFIECVEEQSIKIVGGENVTNNEPLVIPMKPNTLITPSRLREIAEKVENALDEPEIKAEPESNEKNLENESLDQMAVRELIEEAKKEIKIEPSEMAIPTPAKTISEGEKESTLDDYEAVPVQEFGVALLRGMGWTPNNNGPKYKQPELRPKGLGLGADKVIKKKNPTFKDNHTEELAIVKNASVKITSGKYANCYGKVVSLDEENGRVMVDIPVKKEMVSLSEFMMQAVTKSEYEKEYKVINSEAFEEYKKKDLSHTSRQESSSSQGRTEKLREDNNQRIESSHNREKNVELSNGRSRTRRDSSSSEDRSRRKKKSHKKRRSSSSESFSSISEDDRRSHKHKHKSRSRRSRSKSNSRKKTPDGKRDIDKKRKGKKKKRDRDRSPNYKKYRK